MDICDVPKGESILTVTFLSIYHKPKTMDFCVGDVIRGKVFEREGQVMAYLWNNHPSSSSFSLTLTKNQHVDVYITPKGNRIPCVGGTHTFPLLQDEWARVVGLNMEELLIAIKIN